MISWIPFPATMRKRIACATLPCKSVRRAPENQNAWLGLGDQQAAAGYTGILSLPTCSVLLSRPNTPLAPVDTTLKSASPSAVAAGRHNNSFTRLQPVYNLSRPLPWLWQHVGPVAGCTSPRLSKGPPHLQRTRLPPCPTPAVCWCHTHSGMGPPRRRLRRISCRGTSG